MRTREWPIRTRLVALLVTPITSLVALWIFATGLTVGSAGNLLTTQTNYEEAGKPTESLIGEIQHERAMALVALGSQPSDPASLAQQRARTDRAVAEFRRHVTGDELRDSATPEALRRIDDTLTTLKELPSVRRDVDAKLIDRPGALHRYSAMIDHAYRIYLALPGIDEQTISRDSRTVITLSRARELLSQEDALLSGVATAGRFAEGEPGALASLIGTQRFLFTDAIPELPETDADAYQKIMQGDTGSQLRSMEDTIVAQARPAGTVPVDMAAWRGAYDAVAGQLRDAEFTAGDGVLRRGRPVGIAIMIRLIAAALLGLIAVGTSILVSIRVGRSITHRLTGLERAANQLAEDRLPSVVRRLRRGESVDVAAETPPLDLGSDEIGRVGHAFDAVRRTAVESAVHESRLRAGLSKVFLNIARRSQTLLHRQLTLLDAMERRAVDPEQLQELFRIDHLATRMRRNAEDLVILAGAVPARGWRNPVPAIDVVRGAISEVEEYDRVTLQAVPDVAVAGPAVADVIHLLAELIENATAFSPPHTPVVISAQRVPKGLAIDIEDRGLGMRPEAVDEANERLSRRPEFDPANSARLGLFVVAALAARHGVKVRLRDSPYGGITAITLLPSPLVVEETVKSLPAGPAPEQRTPEVRPVPAAATTNGSALPTAPGADGGMSAAAPQSLVVQEPEAPQSLPPVAESQATPVVDPDGPPVVDPDGPPVVERTADGLPRRRRQRSLAPQLRRTPAKAGSQPPATAPADAGSHGAVPAGPPAPRSADAVRSAMSALQAGLLRGRRDSAGAADADEPDDPTHDDPTHDAAVHDAAGPGGDPDRRGDGGPETTAGKEDWWQA